MRLRLSVKTQFDQIKRVWRSFYILSKLTLVLIVWGHRGREGQSQVSTSILSDGRTEKTIICVIQLKLRQCYGPHRVLSFFF